MPPSVLDEGGLQRYCPESKTITINEGIYCECFFRNEHRCIYIELIKGVMDNFFKDNHQNFVMVGMPGAGKSTIGVILAKQTALDFIDTDVLIQVKHERPLQEIIRDDGLQAFRKIEEEVLANLDCKNYVVATGGSAVYSDLAMQSLKKKGVVIFLDVSVKELEKRISNFDTRGIAISSEQTFEDLYNERMPLYRKYADITIDCTDKNQLQIVEEIISVYQG